MTEEALAHVCVLLAGDFHGDHPEMFHVVAGWRLMALRARLGGG